MDAGGILVHCVGGRSRSVAFVAAFLMSCCGWSFDYVINIIKAARPAAFINPGFEVLLQSRLRALKQLRVF
jgi:protein-tyrosine phosphatase